MESKVVVPAQGKKITLQNGKLNVPENPIIPYIEGDGIGVDVTPAMLKVVDAAVEKAYKGERKISWMEIYTGEKSTQVYGQDVWLPAETLDLIREYRVAIKGPLTTPVGGGIRSLNVALRQELDLYICLRPVRYYQGTPSPVKHPELTDMVIFRENSEDIYAGIEWKADSADAEKVIKFLREEMGVKKIRFPEHCGIGIKPCSEEGTKRLVRAAIEYAIANDRDSVTLVHKGNIMKFTEGAFKDWGYQLAREEFGGELIDGGVEHLVAGLHRGHLVHGGALGHVGLVEGIMHGGADHGHAMAAHDHDGLVAHQPRDAVAFLVAVHGLVALAVIDGAVIEQQRVVVGE